MKGVDSMKKIVFGLAVVSIITFVIAWGVGGVMILNNNFESDIWVYVGLVSGVLFFSSLICLKMTRCPHCSRTNPTKGAYCPYCGKKIK